MTAVTAQPQPVGTTIKKALPGVAAGVGIGTAVGVAAAKGLHMGRGGVIPGAIIGGPIALVSAMNSDGKPNKAWQSALIGAAPLGVAGGFLGALGAAFSPKGGGLGTVAFSAGVFGAVGAGIATAAHALTD